MLKPISVNTYARVIRSSWNLALKWNLADYNPWSGLKDLPVDTSSEVLYFTGVQLKALWKGFDGLDWADLWRTATQFALFTGMRVGELVQLRKQNIQPDGVHVEFQTKGRRHRIIPLPEQCRILIKNYVDAPEGEWLFPSPRRKGKPISTDGIERAFRVARKKSGVGERFHMMRHTFAANALSAGIPIYTVTRWLGHTSVQITENYYGHLVPNTQDHLIEVVAKTFVFGKE